MTTRIHTKILSMVSAIALLYGCNPTGEMQQPKTNTTVNGQAAAHSQPQNRQEDLEKSLTISAEHKANVGQSNLQSYVGKDRAKNAEERTLQAANPARRLIPGTVADAFMQPSPSNQLESYSATTDNGFINATNDPLSTFAIDVDTAAYSNIRRFLTGGRVPPPGAVRLEEMVNYFGYSYPQPDTEPFAIHAELGPCPWQPEHRLVQIGLQAKSMKSQDLPPSNLVFLIDVSGSMRDSNKLPLLQKSMHMLVNQLGKNDRLAIVVYAGSDRVLLPPTSGVNKEKITKAINSLTSGGSTHASSGIHTAYELANQHFMPQGNNRVILASDGDFNVGVTSRDELKTLIEKKRETGIYLTVLGFGMGNYHDDTMEILANSGNGNYAYIDSLLEAKKVLVKERASTLFALANDVKIQVEFNPAVVGAYRLLGYENRLLADEDFHDDSKDAGEVGLDHTITALYELIPAGHHSVPKVDPRKYITPPPVTAAISEVMTIKLRYTPKNNKVSVQKSLAVEDVTHTPAGASDDFRFASAVAGFAMMLKESSYKGSLTYPALLELAKNSKGEDRNGYRAEFIKLVEMAQLL